MGAGAYEWAEPVGLATVNPPPPPLVGVAVWVRIVLDTQPPVPLVAVAIRDMANPTLVGVGIADIVEDIVSWNETAGVLKWGN
jgi:hypothetical protein